MLHSLFKSHLQIHINYHYYFNDNLYKAFIFKKICIQNTCLKMISHKNYLLLLAKLSFTSRSASFPDMNCKIN